VTTYVEVEHCEGDDAPNEFHCPGEASNKYFFCASAKNDDNLCNNYSTE
jgi:hypothetical protein